MKITIEKLDDSEQTRLGINDWPIWECAPSTFDWHYDEEESCLILTGDITVTTKDQTVHIQPGDYVTFPKGLSCTWQVNEAVRKHYTFR